MFNTLVFPGRPGERRWLLLSDGAHPTEDIYFLDSAAEVIEQEQGIAASRIDTRRRFINRHAIRPWLENANVLVCRSLGERWLSWLESARELPARIVYLIDDDIAAALDTPGLPRPYRRRLKHIAHAQQPRLLSLCDEVVCCSEALAIRMREAHGRVSVLPPPLLTRLPDLSHHEQAPMRTGYYGTRAHLDDIAFIAPALQDLHDADPDVTIEIMLGAHLPATLRGLPRVATPAPQPWSKFRHFMSRRRIHVGLAPLLDTPFNRCKSHVKFLDIAAMGGVGVYSRRSPYGDIVEHGVDGLLIDDSPSAWRTALIELVKNPRSAYTMAQAAARKAALLGEPRKAADFWLARG